MKKYLIFSLCLMIVGVGAFVALAEETNITTTTTATTTSTVNNPSPMMINIGPKGNVMLRGIVVSVGTDSMVVKSWGGSWTIQVSSTTKITSLNKLLSDFKVDGFVGVIGNISQDGGFVIDASILRAWGYKQDSDKDGIPDNQDNDDDNDGLENNRDLKHRDHDDDGIIDSVDTDDDNDGVLDTQDTKPFDRNNDGVPDFRDKRGGKGDLIKVMMENRIKLEEHRDGENSGSDNEDDN